MVLKVLGMSGAEFPGNHLPAFLIDGTMLLDAGTIGSKLRDEEQAKIQHILVSHCHLDHIRGIPFLADNALMRKTGYSIRVYGTGYTLEALRKNLFNGRIWPDFTRITVSGRPVMKLREILPGRSFRIDGYAVRAYNVNHTIPAVGYLVRDSRMRALLYTGDTGPTEEIWKASEKCHAVIAEVSFPNAMEGLARKTGHLTPGMLSGELAKMKRIPERVFVSHPKPQYSDHIRKELRKIRAGKIEMLREGRVYEI